MNVTLKRDGLTLRGELLKPDVEKCPILIIFHGFMANIGKARLLLNPRAINGVIVYPVL